MFFVLEEGDGKRWRKEKGSAKPTKGPFGLNLLLLKLKTENWKHCSKIIFKCVNSVVWPVNNVFCPLHSKIMWFYCSRVGKKKKNRKRKTWTQVLVETKWALRVCLNRTYFAETENWKHENKIIFKCGNSIVGPIFNEKVAEKWNL